MVLVRRAILLQYLFGGIAGSGVHDELRIVLPRHLRRIGSMEARRRLADERSNARYPFIRTEHARQRVCHRCTLRYGASFAQINLHCQTLTVRFGQ